MTTPEAIAKRVNWKRHASNLSGAIVPKQLVLLEIAWEAQRKKFPIIGAFDLKNPNVQKLIPGLAKRVVGISEYSRTEIVSMLDQALAGAGKIPGTDEIARRFRLIAELSEPEGATRQELRRAVRRAQTIARTETTTAFNHGAVASYAEAGVEKVELLDSDNDPECAERNGKIVSLEEALEIEPHPNCVLAFAPVVD